MHPQTLQITDTQYNGNCKVTERTRLYRVGSAYSTRYIFSIIAAQRFGYSADFLRPRPEVERDAGDGLAALLRRRPVVLD